MNNELGMRNRRGNLLIESIVALSVATVGILGVLGILSRSLSINRDVGQKFIAAYLAAEGVEITKSLIDKNFADGNPWNTGIGDCGSSSCDYEAAYSDTALGAFADRFLNFDPASGIFSYDAGNPTPFKRKISITGINLDGGDDELKVVSAVTWTGRDGPETISLEDRFFAWR